MPIYEYMCRSCGLFECWRPLQATGELVLCPICAAEARRVYTPPGLVKTSAVLTQRLDRAYKSAYEPEVVARPPASQEERPATPRIVHGHGRPWQLGH